MYPVKVRAGHVNAGAAATVPSPPAAQDAAAQPAQRSVVLIAEIENRTGDPVFDETIRQALMLPLAQSPFLDLISDRKAQVKVSFIVGTMRSEDNEEVLNRLKQEFERILR